MGPVSPEAAVLMMSLGKPIGNAVRIAEDAREVPPVPPAEMMPWKALLGSWRLDLKVWER